MPPRIRSATALDLEAMAAMKDAAWRETYPGLVPDAVLAGLDARRPRVVERWGRELRDGASYWVAVDEGGIVGVTHACVAPEPPRGVPLELAMLYLLERVKGTGLGQALLHTAIGDADAHLWVLEGNRRAIAFYTRNGFIPDGAAKDVPGMPGGVREIRMVRCAEPDEA
ncbi:MAG: GNAT family N-acetyltransferase [Propionibacteriaceae bacterium]|nr:GNAT family N-acetyltransferase [Propionibacteriaceae bacterium]